MAGGGSENRTEQPTGRKLRKAREKGQVARSKEVSSATVLLGGLITISFFGQTLVRAFEFEMKHLLRFRVPSELTISYLTGVVNGVGWRIGFVVMPIILVAVICSIAANMMQGGLVFSTEPLGLHFGKLNPQNGFGRIFSKNGIVELLKSLALLIVIAYISYQVIAEYLPIYPRLILMDVRKLLHWTAFISYQVFIRVAVLLVIVAVADYFFQKYRHKDQLKMTKQEVKDEFKETEGDPTTKGRIRRIQRELARKRMMADVPNADVIITNPTHYAVALSYKMDSMDAPRVVAKGVGFLAQKIKELAQEHGIPLVENRPLAQTLYKTVEVGESIPSNLYKAVAEILALIYKAKNALSR
jgi:flagellar biosynthesis protein FlhB